MQQELNDAIKSLEEKVSGEVVDGSIKFEIEGLGSIVIESGKVEQSDRETDCTLLGTMNTFKDIFDGNLNSTSAFMSGKLRIEGSMSVAMKYNVLFA